MSNERTFSGKVALVTGGGSGIGDACAAEFAARGCQMVIADLTMDTAERVAKDIWDRNAEVAAVEASVADPSSVEAMVRSAVQQYGGLDIRRQ